MSLQPLRGITLRIEEFEALLAAPKTSSAASLLTVPPAYSLPAGEVFVPYDQLSCHGIRFTRVHLRRLIRRGLFPAPIRLSPNRIAWRSSDLMAFKISRPSVLPTTKRG